MREIKFRAMSLGAWLYFVISPTEENYNDTISFGSPGHRALKKEGLTNWGEYTGLKDKNGKEIYEGDILQYRDTYGKPTKYVIDWSIQRNVSGFTFWANMGDIYPMEILGNIYENPELISP